MCRSHNWCHLHHLSVVWVLCVTDHYNPLRRFSVLLAGPAKFCLRLGEAGGGCEGGGYRQKNVKKQDEEGISLPRGMDCILIWDYKSKKNIRVDFKQWPPYIYSFNVKQAKSPLLPWDRASICLWLIASDGNSSSSLSQQRDYRPEQMRWSAQQCWDMDLHSTEDWKGGCWDCVEV